MTPLSKTSSSIKRFLGRICEISRGRKPTSLLAYLRTTHWKIPSTRKTEKNKPFISEKLLLSHANNCKTSSTVNDSTLAKVACADIDSSRSALRPDSSFKKPAPVVYALQDQTSRILVLEIKKLHQANWRQSFTIFKYNILNTLKIDTYWFSCCCQDKVHAPTLSPNTHIFVINLIVFKSFSSVSR